MRFLEYYVGTVLQQVIINSQCIRQGAPRLYFVVEYDGSCATLYASAVLAVIVCSSVRPSVRPSVCVSQVGILLRRLNLLSRKQLTIAQGL